MQGGAKVVEDADDSDWLSGLDQVTHDLVVEVLDWSPLYVLLHVLLLRGGGFGGLWGVLKALFFCFLRFLSFGEDIWWLGVL